MGEERIEEARGRYRPESIMVLFVGESPPQSGAFFYCGNNAMLSHMKAAVELAFGPSPDFLETFKSYGWYLDDLVREPVDKLPAHERWAMCCNAATDLADRLTKYKPHAIVSVLTRITPLVARAAKESGSGAPVHSVPFPGMGHQVRFRKAMAELAPRLPRLPVGA